MSDGRLLASAQHHEGFLGQRIGPVTAVAWHENQPLLAVGGADSIVSVYNCAGGLGV